MRFLVLLASAPLWMSNNASAATIYLCSAYSGGTFWASSHCNQHQGLVERIVTVPDGMPFEQQVDLGRQQLQKSRALTQPSPANSDASPSQSNHKARCSALEAKVVHYDAIARQPQTGKTQDWIRQERKKLRDERVRLRC